jgi:hypothetical protein
MLTYADVCCCEIGELTGGREVLLEEAYDALVHIYTFTPPQVLSLLALLVQKYKY